MLSRSPDSTSPVAQFRAAGQCLTLAPMDQLRDRDLMQRYAKGDERAFEELYGRHKGPLYRFLSQRCFERETADEVFQEVWTKVIRARRSYTPKARFTTWLYRLARNTYVDHVRHVSRRVRLVSNDEQHEDVASATPGPADQARGDELAQRFRQALGALPPEQMEVFLLHQEAGLTLPQIARVVNVGRETVKSRLRYALAKLRAELEEQDDQTTGISA